MYLAYNKNLGKWFLNKIFNSIKKYRMIDNGERVAVALSGGKDSLFLLFVMSYLRLYYPIKYDLYAIHVDIRNFFQKYSLGEVIYSNDFLANLSAICEKLKIEFFVEELGKFIDDKSIKNTCIENENKILNTISLLEKLGIRKNKNTICSLCARLKRGVMAARCRKLGVTKLAFAHHATDVAETLLMNIVFSQKLASITPRVKVPDSEVQIIRPLIFIDEKIVTNAVRYLEIPVIQLECPYSYKNIRKKFKTIIKNLENELGEYYISEKFAKSLSNPDLSSLWPSLEQ